MMITAIKIMNNKTKITTRKIISAQVLSNMNVAELVEFVKVNCSKEL